MILSLFAVGFIIALASLIAVVIVSTISEARITKLLPSFISFSAGTFLFTTGFMLVESFHTLEDYLLVGALAVAGYIGAFVLSKTVPHIHHHDNGHSHKHSKSGRNVLAGDALHNIADGFILVPAFMVSPVLGLGTAMSIFIHEALQEISEFFVLKHAGFDTKKALIYNFLVSLTIFIGIGLGLLILNTEVIQGVLLAIAAGFFMFVLLQDLIPSHHGALKTKDGLWHILLLIIGVVILFAVQSFFGHSHEHEEGHVHVEHYDEATGEIVDLHHQDEHAGETNEEHENH